LVIADFLSLIAFFLAADGDSFCLSFIGDDFIVVLLHVKVVIYTAV
jgi:hypothetical protein